ncbi:hypothetical protein GW17_00026304 [Ensete ventricosum]|nr:hypothetical protein GW17_00026304 [Ensete ventricosum]
MEMGAAIEQKDKGLGEGGANINGGSAAPTMIAGKAVVIVVASRHIRDDIQGSAQDWVIVVVKQLKDMNLVEREFKEKIEAIDVMDHSNLVPLMAYYSKDEKLMVYDYMPMVSLFALLHCNRGSSRTPLNWETRTGIALATVRDIEYIHSMALPPHMATSSPPTSSSPSYMMLVCPTTSLSFSLSALTHVAGYWAQEVTDALKVCQKADVYRFNVVCHGAGANHFAFYFGTNSTRVQRLPLMQQRALLKMK